MMMMMGRRVDDGAAEPLGAAERVEDVYPAVHSREERLAVPAELQAAPRGGRALLGLHGEGRKGSLDKVARVKEPYGAAAGRHGKHEPLVVEAGDGLRRDAQEALALVAAEVPEAHAPVGAGGEEEVREGRGAQGGDQLAVAREVAQVAVVVERQEADRVVLALAGGVDDGGGVVAEGDGVRAVLFAVEDALPFAALRVVDVDRVVVAGRHEQLLGPVERERVDRALVLGEGLGRGEEGERLRAYLHCVSRAADGDGYECSLCPKRRGLSPEEARAAGFRGGKGGKSSEILKATKFLMKVVSLEADTAVRMAVNRR